MRSALVPHLLATLRASEGPGNQMKRDRVSQWMLHLGSSSPLALSFPGGGGVLFPDPGHAGVLFPLRAASKCLSGGLPGLPPEPSVSQYPLKGLWTYLNPCCTGSCGYFSEGGNEVGSLGRRSARTGEERDGETAQG